MAITRYHRSNSTNQVNYVNLQAISSLYVTLVMFCSPLQVINSTWAKTPKPPQPIQANNKTNSQLNLYIRQLQTGNQKQRISAIESLAALGKPAVTPLIEVLKKDKDPVVRAAAVVSIGKIGEDAGSALPALTAALRDSDQQVRKNAVQAIPKLGKKAMVPHLVLRLQSQNWRDRYNAIHAISRMGKDAAPAIPHLIKTIKSDSEVSVRFGAINAIANLGPVAAPAFPVLIEAMEEKHDSISPGAAYALGNIAVSLHENASQLSIQDIDKTISKLEKAVQIINNPSFKFPEKSITYVSEPLEALKQERRNRLRSLLMEGLGARG